MSLIDGLEMHHVVIANSSIDRGPQGDIQFPVVIVTGRRHRFRRHAVADGPDMFIGQTGETLAHDLNAYAAGAFPVYRATEDAGLHVQGALKIQYLALIQPEAFAVHKQLDGQPVWRVCQFLFRDGDGIKDAIDQGCGSRSRIAFIKGAACSKVAVTYTVHCLFAMEFFRIKCMFSYLPEIHCSPFLNTMIVKRFRFPSLYGNASEGLI